jgi:hypothetical protein
MFEDWNAENRELHNFTPMLDIAGGHRARLIEMLRADAQAAYEFLARYSRLDFAQEAGLYSSEWREIAQEFAAGLSLPEIGADSFPLWFAANSGLMTWSDAVVANIHGPSLIQMRVDETIEGPGLLWHTIGTSDSTASLEAMWELARDQVLASNLDYRYFNLDRRYLSACGGVVDDATFPADLAVALCLLLEPDAAPSLAKAVRWPEASTFAGILRTARDEVAFARTYNKARDASRVTVGELARRWEHELKAEYKSRWPGRVPSWVLNYADLGKHASKFGWRTTGA